MKGSFLNGVVYFINFSYFEGYGSDLPLSNDNLLSLSNSSMSAFLGFSWQN